MNSFLRSLNWRIRFFVACRPGLRFFYQYFVARRRARMRARGSGDPREADVDGSTGVVIDGFPGSGNSFVTRVFKATQDEKLIVANHLHCPAQMLRGVELGLPVVLVLRHPRDAVLSMHRRWSHYPLAMCLRQYVAYHRALENAVDRILVSSFEESTQRVNSVVRRINAKFGTDFVDDFNPEEVQKHWVRGERMKSLSDDEKQALKDAKQAKIAELESPALAALLSEAEEIYAKFLKYAES